MFLSKKPLSKGGMIIPVKNYITRFFNISKDQIESFELIKLESGFEAHIKLKKNIIDCPFCGGPVITHGYKRKKIKNDIFLESNDLIIWFARRYLCKDCGHTFMERNPFSLPKAQVSIATSRRIMNDLRNLHFTFQDIALKNNVSPSLVQLYLDSFVNIPRQTLPESIGIDEVYSSLGEIRNSAYICTLVDNVNRSLFEVLPSRSKNYLSRYFGNIALEERKTVKYVTIDMWEPYKDIIEMYLPNAIIAVDPFHVVKHLLEAFNRIRLDIQNQVLQNSDTYYLLKHWNWILNKNNVDLDNEPVYNHRFRRKLNRRDIFSMILDINESLTLGYRIKEKYLSFNKEATYENAEEWLDQIIEMITYSEIPQYEKFLNLLNHWKPEIINSFLRPYEDRKLSNALCENINGQIGTLIKISKGLANFSRFRKRVLFALNDKIFYALTEHLKSDKRKGKPRGPYNKKY